MACMEVTLVEPYGYCYGVLKAIEVAERARQEDPERPIYCLGRLVHNEKAVSELAKKGVFTLVESSPDLGPLLNDAPKGSTILFSAHGHESRLESLCPPLGLSYIDAACPYVKANAALGKAKLGHVAYIGAKGHAECFAFLKNVRPIAFFDVKEGKLTAYKEGKPLGAIAQTTLSEAEIEAGLSVLRAHYGEMRLLAGRCPETIRRQKEVKEALKKADCLLVLGSNTSSNSRKLLELALSSGTPAYLALGLEEVKRLDLSPYRRLALCSGASTSKQEVLRCRDYLLSL